MGRREAIVTLVACALLGFEALPSLLFGFVVPFGTGGPPYNPLSGLLGLLGGCALGLVLLRQGGVSVPSREERGATRGALAGFAVGVVIFGARPRDRLRPAALGPRLGVGRRSVPRRRVRRLCERRDRLRDEAAFGNVAVYERTLAFCSPECEEGEFSKGEFSKAVRSASR